MREISKEVGTSAAALYHHLPDKQSLYLAVMEFVFADKVGRLAASLDRHQPPLDQLKQLLN